MKTSLTARVLSLLLLAVMLFNLAPLSAVAQVLDGMEDLPTTEGTEDTEENEDPDGEIDYTNAVPVTSADELEVALTEGAPAINLMADFELDRTFYVVSDTVIVSDEVRTLRRAAGFGGDIFVVGENSDGTATEKGVVLTLGKPDDTTPSLITIDGNAGNMTASVVGTVVFVRGGSRADLYHNVTMTNHVKVGNDRTLNEVYSLSYPIRIGGAVAIVSSKASMRIYGGLYENNSVNDITDADTDEGNTSSQGGVIYNYGTLDIFGGSFKGNHAARGGALYNYRTMNIYNADISFNSASSLGGAIYVPNSTAAYLYIGEEIDDSESIVRFAGNTSAGNGGAIYAQHVLSVKNAVFEANVSTGNNGGAISAGGMELSIEASTFSGNKADGGYGGAVYISGSNGDEEIRELIVSGSSFDGNSAMRGGAVYMSGSARGYFSGTAFKSNSSSTNGGAISLYSNAAVLMNAITAEGNTSALAGFAYINAATLDLFNSTISKNSSTGNGGAVYAYTDSVFNAYKTTFAQNSSAASGGGVMIYNGGTNALLHSCTFEGNTANQGGGLYISNKSKVELYSLTGINNSADKGGFMYETTASTVVTLVGLVVSGNTATTGGPIIWGNTTNAKLYIDKLKYVDNDYTGDWDDAYWSGAIYNLLTVYDKTGTVPNYTDYNGQIVVPPAPVSITNVTTAAQLERALQVGYTHIRITASFEIDRTLYIMGNTTIFADAAVTLTRAPDFGGDMFVVGEDASGNHPETEVILTLCKKDGSDASLVIDGNAANMAVDVVGTVIFVCDGATAELGKNLTVQNNKKVGNERLVANTSYRVSYHARVGGAVAIVEGGAVLNVYGGTYASNTTNDITADTDEGSLSSHGGAFYNYGTMNVYGGTFQGNHAGRGGAFYNYRTMNIYNATVVGNSSSTYGGAIYMPNSTAAYLYIGEQTDLVENAKVYFTENSSANGGGAIYAKNLLVIKNAVFAGNTAGKHGGAIYATETRMTFDQVSFEQNTASASGGAIYLSGSNNREQTRELVMLNSSFVGNTATTSGGAIYMSSSARAYFYHTDFTANSTATGGVFYVTGASLEINGSTLSGNQSSSSGGVFALYSSSVVLLNDLRLTENSAGASGGVAYLNSGATMSIYNSTVSKNTAASNAGVAYVYKQAVFNAYNTTFIENSCGSSGGALMIYNEGVSSLLHSCTFEGNTAASGGGLYVSNLSQLDMYNITATNNKADKGGFMYETTADTVVNLVGLTVSGNTASSGGAVIWGNTYNAKLHIDTSKYTDLDTTAPLDDAYWATAIYNKLTWDAISGEIPRYLDYGNEAYDNMADAVDVATAAELESAIRAGVKHIRIVADFELDRTFYITGDVTIFSTITRTLTRAPGFGGDIFVVGETESGLSALRLGANAKLTLGNPLSVQENLLIIDGNAANMAVDVVGSVLFICESSTVTLHQNLTVQNCRKVGNERTMTGNYQLSIPNRIGGAMAIVESGTLEICGGIYQNNIVNEELDSTEEGRWSSVGGLIFNSSNLIIRGGTFTGNVGARGAVIYNYRVVRLLGGSFINNTATVSGGVYYAPNSAQVHLYVGSADADAAKVLFEGNTAESSGGAIYASTLSANVIYGNASFISNHVTSGSGGAICMYGQLTVRGARFEGNTSTNRGGAIYASNSSLESVTRYVEVTNCTFVANEAVLGGAISLYASSADYPEGAIITITGSTFRENKASLEISGASSAHGGAIYADRKVSLTVKDSSFTQNTAATEAGAIYLAGESMATIQNSTLAENSTGKYGGAIAVRSSYLDLIDSQISSSYAPNNGGAIYVSYQSNREINSKVTISGSTISSNASDANGGAIYATRRSALEDAWNILTVKSSTFEGNTAALSGGALYTLSKVGIYMENVSFKNNLATTDEAAAGGAMAVSGSILEINGADFSGNKATAKGGALMLDSSAEVILNNVTATGNESTLGGFVYMTGSAALDLYNSVIADNTAAENGGAIYAYTKTTLKVYDTTFRGNAATGNGGALMIYNGGTDALVQNSLFESNVAQGVGGAIYVSNKSQLQLYDITATKNSAPKGGFMYETTSGTVVILAGLTVSQNTAENGGAIIWGNTANAKLQIDKSKYTDLDATGALDDAYWSEAIYNALTVEAVSVTVPTYESYVHEEPAAPAPEQKPVVSVDDVFGLGQSSSDGYINSTYNAFPKLDNSSNFMSDGTTYFENINGETVTVDSFVYNTYATDGNVNVGQGLLIYQAMLYKQAHPDEEVSIAVSSYRFSTAAALNINRNSRYFGYMRNLHGRDYDEFGFVRIAYLLVSAAKMGIRVTVIGHIDAYPLVETDANLYEYFTGHLDTPCDPAYTEGVVGDYMNFSQIYWTLDQKGGTDMMHNKMCAVSHYLDMNGVAHKNAVFSSSANLDGITSKGYNGNWKLQTATIVSDHEQIYRVAVNYLNLITQYTEQEAIYEFQDIMSRRGAEQVDLILAGRASEIPANEQIVYLGTENDDVFELYFTPFPGGTAVWDETYNPYTKYLRELYNSEGSIIFSWNAAEYNSEYSLGQQLEDIIVGAFYNNKNVENKFYGNMEHFDQTKLDGLVVGEDIGYISINKQPFGAVHNKDILLSYVKNGQRYYVSLLNSCNQHSGSMCYQSNFMLVIKETDCDEDSVFFTMADLSTTGIVEHTYGDEQIEPATPSSHGYYYIPCLYCDKKIITGTIHYEGEWITDRAPVLGLNGIQHKECTVCSSITQVKETVIKEIELENSNVALDGIIFNANNKVDTNVATTPLTMEAVIQLDKEVNGRGGVIVSNYYAEGKDLICLEVFTNGRIRLYTRTGGIICECIFATDVRSDAPVHIAVTVDGTVASLYVDGLLSDTQCLARSMPTINEQMMIGGDNRVNNYQYFKGVIYSVALFEDVRTPAEIAKDMILVPADTEGLLYVRSLSEEKTSGFHASEIGTTFAPDYSIGLNTLVATPITIEAILHLPKSYSDRAGVVFGNYDGTTRKQLNLEIYSNGAPRLYICGGGSLTATYMFNADVRSDTPVHMAITIGTTTASLYLDGQLVDTVALQFALPEVISSFKVGGDNRTGNAQYFKGTIYGVGVYGTARTDAQILSDSILMDATTEDLLYLCYYKPVSKQQESSTQGETFTPEQKIEVGTLTTTPHTFEATIRVLPDEFNRVGVIVGNYDNSTDDQINLEILYNGNIRFFYNSGYRRSECLFTSVDVRSYTAKHIAVTVLGRLVSLYVDGILVETQSLTFDLPAATQGFAVGGDNRDGNTQYFKGEIFSVYLFGDVRTADEILLDKQSVASDADALLFAGEFAEVITEKPSGTEYRPEGQIFDGTILDRIPSVTTSPLTFEAILRVPREIEGRAGVIVGNYYGGHTAQINLEIFEGGRVRLFFVNNGVRVDTVFSTDIRSDAPVHLALTIDGTLATLYINGEAVETAALPIPVPAVTNNYVIGGDYRENNVHYFKGTLYSVALFEDVRTPEEIKQDVRFVTESDEQLLYIVRYAEQLCVPYSTGAEHIEGSWIIDREATEDLNGLMHKECLVCGRTLAMREISNTRKDGEHFDYTGHAGLTFGSESDSVSVDSLASAPLTFEAVIQLDPDQTVRGGVIFGSYDGGSLAAFNVEIYNNGNPRIYYKISGIGYSYVFKTDVRSESLTHIAITIDGLVARLYVNGKYCESLKMEKPVPTVTENYQIGNDRRPASGQYFKGTIYSVSLFDDVRSAEEIAADALKVMSDADGLLYTVFFSEEK